MQRLRVIQYAYSPDKAGRDAGELCDRTIITLPAVRIVPTVYAARPGLLTLRDVGLQHAPVGAWRS